MVLYNTPIDLSSALDNEQFGALSETDTFASIAQDDHRLRIRAKTGQEDQIYGPLVNENVLAIMHPHLADSTNGLLFPYTPTITFDQTVSYNDMSLVHTNGGYSTYEGTPNANIIISGEFTFQNQRDGVYAIAVLHFLRVMSKMYFGEEDKRNKKAGLPPPVLLLEGYGNGMFNQIPVIIKTHSWSFDKSQNLSLATNPEAGISMMLPPVFTLNLNLSIQRPPILQRTEFSLDKFRTGEMMRNNKGWI